MMAALATQRRLSLILTNETYFCFKMRRMALLKLIRGLLTVVIVSISYSVFVWLFGGILHIDNQILRWGNVFQNSFHNQLLHKKSAQEEQDDKLEIYLKKVYSEWKRRINIPDNKAEETSKIYQRFQSRSLVLREGCAELKSSGETVTHGWSWQRIKTGRGLLPEDNTLAINIQGTHGVCLIPKSGSKSWKKYIKILLSGAKHFSESLMHEPPSDEDILILSVRHPLDRLHSAYRDKFLNGAPISLYTETYIKEYKTAEPWEKRWYSYWLPVLISSGKVEHTEDFRKAIARAKSNTTFHKRFMYTVEDAYGPELDKLKQLHEDAKFTFVEFLNHVLWTRKVGLSDHHWIPQSEFCDVCNRNFKYIMKLELINEELDYFLKANNYKKHPPFVETHNSDKKDIVRKPSYIDYYRNVPLELLHEILDLYKYDFLLFGYSM